MRVAPTLLRLPAAQWGRVLARVDSAVYRRHLREVSRTVPSRAPELSRAASRPGGPAGAGCVERGCLITWGAPTWPPKPPTRSQRPGEAGPALFNRPPL